MFPAQPLQALFSPEDNRAVMRRVPVLALCLVRRFEHATIGLEVDHSSSGGISGRGTGAMKPLVNVVVVTGIGIVVVVQRNRHVHAQ